MLHLIEIANNTYNDTWKMTFYYVLALAILLGLLWTVYKEYRNEKKAIKTNEIYDKPYDAIEEDVFLRKKGKTSKENQVTNYYDIYSVANKDDNYDKISTKENVAKIDRKNNTNLSNNLNKNKKNNYQEDKNKKYH